MVLGGCCLKITLSFCCCYSSNLLHTTSIYYDFGKTYPVAFRRCRGLSWVAYWFSVEECIPRQFEWTNEIMITISKSNDLCIQMQVMLITGHTHFLSIDNAIILCLEQAFTGLTFFLSSIVGLILPSLCVNCLQKTSAQYCAIYMVLSTLYI